MCRVLNKYKHKPTSNSVYIGRGSKWGNPFVIGKHGDREQVITKYRKWLLDQPKLVEQVRQELKGKDLMCFCKPQKCHGDILISIANE